MLDGVTTRWKQTIGYHFTGNTYSATEANEIILSILKKAHSIKLDVCAIISDMGPQNRALWRLNQISAGRFSKINNVQEYLINDTEKKKKYFVADATHVYKNIRLALTDGNTLYLSQDVVSKYNLPTNEITIEPIKKVVEEDNKMELKIAPYLKETHLNPNHYQKMAVQGAMAILNHDTSAAIKFYISKGKISQNHLTTAWFLELIYKWYSILSSRSAKLGLSKNNMVEYEETLKFLKDMIHITSNIKIGQKGHWKPIQTGILLSTQTVLDLQEKFLNTHKFQYLLLSRFTQDALENLFSNIRSRNPVPNAKEFKTAMRLISVSQYFKEPKYGNYGITDDIPLVDFFTDDNQSDIEVEPFLTIDSSADDRKRNIKNNQLH